MILDKLSLHNFAIYKGEQEFDLNPLSKEKPIILIGAMNGSGKTTFLQSIDFLLYGKNSNTFKSQNLSYEGYLEKNIHTDHKNDGASISLNFRKQTRGKEENFKVVRMWKKSGEKIKENFYVYVNDILDEIITKDWDNFIEQILPAKVAQLFFFDGEKIEQLADLDQSKEVLRKAIDSLLGLEIVTRLNLDLDEFAKKSAVLSKDDKDLKIINEFEDRVNLINKDIKKLEEKKIKLEDDSTKIKFEISALDQELDRSGLSFFDKKKEIELTLENKNKENDDLKNNLLNIAALEGPLLLVKKELKEIEEKLLNNINQNNKDLVSEEKNNLIKDIKSFTEKDCKDSNFKEKLFNFLVSKQIKSTFAEQDFSKINGLSLENLKEMQNKILPDLDKKTNFNLSQLKENILDIEKLEIESKKIPAEDKIKPIINKQESLKIEVIQILGAIKQINEQIEQKNSEKRPKEFQLKKLYQIQSDKKTELLDSERFVVFSEKTQIIMDQFKKRVLEHHIFKLENFIKECFNVLIRKEEFLEKVKIDINNFALLLYDKKDRNIETSTLSAGERQLLAVAILWALAKASNKLSPTIIDTPLGRLDSKHRLNLVEKYFPNASHQVILLSTDEEINKNYLNIMKESISKSYLINFDPKINGSVVEKGYFF
ncbi:MAG: DNA sulfur modification protein DndD [Pelagibacteraceae bacterium]|nr:DNA sulfur modification protein DndD [Pelagibacteraceae bacterium]